MANHSKGFSLVELLIVVVILGIILGIGVPSYREYVIRANRVDATAALMKLQADQEKHFLQFNTYAANIAGARAADNLGWGKAASEKGFYGLTVAANAGGLVNGFVATARPAAGESQAGDDDCWTMTINEQGLRQAQSKGGADHTALCWR